MGYLDFNRIEQNIQGLIKGIEIFSDTIKSISALYQNNSEKLLKYIRAFADFGVWSVAIDKLLKNQIVFTDNLSQELANGIYNGMDVEKVVWPYYLDNNEYNTKRLIERCQQYEQVQKYSELYDEIISSYYMGHYLLACIGLFSLIDGVLSDVSKESTTNFKKRLDLVKEKFDNDIELNEIDRKTICIYQAFNSFESSIFSNSDFSKEEPHNINRHWDLHGRTRRPHSKTDFIKVLLWLDAIIFLSDKDIPSSEENRNEHL